MDKSSRSDKKQVSLKKDKSESLVSNENEVTISREYVVNDGRGEGIAHQLKYLEEARGIVLSFEEIKEYAVKNRIVWNFPKDIELD